MTWLQSFCVVFAVFNAVAGFVLLADAKPNVIRIGQMCMITALFLVLVAVIRR